MQAGEGTHQQKGRDREDDGDGSVCGRRFGHNALQRADDISAVSEADELGGRGGALDAGRCQWEELDVGVHLPDRALPFLVRLASVTGPRSQEIPGTALRYILHLLLRGPAVLGHRCLHGERPSSLDVSLRRRAFHHRLCGNNPTLKLYILSIGWKRSQTVTIWML